MARLFQGEHEIAHSHLMTAAGAVNDAIAYWNNVKWLTLLQLELQGWRASANIFDSWHRLKCVPVYEIAVISLTRRPSPEPVSATKLKSDSWCPMWKISCCAQIVLGTWQIEFKTLWFEQWCETDSQTMIATARGLKRNIFFICPSFRGNSLNSGWPWI